jgi:hypothetical protein
MLLVFMTEKTSIRLLRIITVFKSTVSKSFSVGFVVINCNVATKKFWVSIYVCLICSMSHQLPAMQSKQWCCDL